MKLSLENINYSYKDLSPVMSEDTLKYHRDNLAKSYVKRFNEGKGDLSFNEAGAFLHNLFFPQFKKPKGSNQPFGISKEFINENFSSLESLKEEISSIAMSIQGSGWVYLSMDGKIKTIKNHQIKKDILILIDWWEHAWSLDYKSDKRKYLNNFWRILDWEVINKRLSLEKSSERTNKLRNILLKAGSNRSSKRVYPQNFRVWLSFNIYDRKIDSRSNISSRMKLSNYFFRNEDETVKERLYNRWLNETAQNNDGEKAEVQNYRDEERPDPEPFQLELFSSYSESDVLKEAVLKKKVRKTRGKGKKDRKEWGLFSKKDPSRPLKWFGPNKPSKKEVAKEEARIHAFSS